MTSLASQPILVVFWPTEWVSHIPVLLDWVTKLTKQSPTRFVGHGTESW
jgi:hypothetical protein